MTNFIIKYRCSGAALEVLFGALKKAEGEGIELISILPDEAAPAPEVHYRKKRKPIETGQQQAQRKIQWALRYRAGLQSSMVAGRVYDLSSPADLDALKQRPLDKNRDGYLTPATLNELLNILSGIDGGQIVRVGTGKFWRA
jgi:hypothetical protein